MWPFYLPKQGPAPEQKWISELTIKFTDGGTFALHHDLKGSHGWKKFLKWYHGRLQSTNYRLQYKNGQITFQRKHIYSFTIVRREVDV